MGRHTAAGRRRGTTVIEGAGAAARKGTGKVTQRQQQQQTAEITTTPHSTARGNKRQSPTLQSHALQGSMVKALALLKRLHCLQLTGDFSDFATTKEKCFFVTVGLLDSFVYRSRFGWFVPFVSYSWFVPSLVGLFCSCY